MCDVSDAPFWLSNELKDKFNIDNGETDANQVDVEQR